VLDKFSPVYLCLRPSLSISLFIKEVPARMASHLFRDGFFGQKILGPAVA
jgi:hypothetical protein